tara:strand:+ start:1075 stop:1641 length:567 start_codon:yes stop_codon:yes gene_type:complete
MTYRDLYDFVQTQDIHIKRTALRDRITAAYGPLKVMQTGIDTNVSRGYYLSPKNTEHPFVKMCGSCVILIARDQNRCWQRFVEFKELMHIFDDPSEASDTGEVFDRLLAEFSGAATLERSPQMTSEIKAFWMALSLCCPEEKRAEFQNQRLAGTTDDYSIALALRVPQQYVPNLFGPNYQPILAFLRK